MFKKETIDKIKESIGDNLVSSHCRGNTLWTVERVGDDSLLFQIKFNKDEYSRISESEGPDQFFCSRRLLDISKPVNPEWREKVLDYWRMKDEAKDQWSEIKERFRTLSEDETILIYFKPGWNLEFGYLENPISGKVRYGGKLWKIKQRDSIQSWEVIRD